MQKIKAIFGPMRIPFLLLTPSCVFLGAGVSYWRMKSIEIPLALLILLGALSAHVSVNAFNEYFDWKSGLDKRTTRTPFSGGSGTLPENPGLAPYALAIAWISFSITLALGIYFVWLRGWMILPIGIGGLLFLILYTIWFTKNPLLCLVSPGLGFGTFMVMGTDFVLSGDYSWSSFIASLIPFFLVSDLLLLNQFPDIEPDQEVGRKHIPIIYGVETSSIIYGVFLLFAYLAVIAGVILNMLPRASLLGIITVPLAFMAFLGAYKHGNDIKKLIPFMGMNVLVNLFTPALVGLGLFLA